MPWMVVGIATRLPSISQSLQNIIAEFIVKTYFTDLCFNESGSPAVAESEMDRNITATAYLIITPLLN
jgi:hypothetical protein